MTTTKKKQYRVISNEESWALHEKKIDRLVGNFSAAFMSNAKWRKALSLLAESRYLVNLPHSSGRYRWKFVDEDRIWETPVIQTRDLGEKGMTDNGYSFIYREIEWLEVVTDHAQAITGELLERGQFALDKSESGFKIIGYASPVS